MKSLPIENPPNPWAQHDIEYIGEPPRSGLLIYEDETRSILSRNDSPDIGFELSINPYRGCYHGCAYCYARPSHEYLGFGAGSDFERKIVVKLRAPELLRAELSRRSWQPQLLVFSGNTDCYQPLEASYRLTRRCLEVCADLGNPVHIITKAPLIERDLDVLGRLNEQGLVTVSISVPFWNTDDARKIEPGVATPQRRIVAIRTLSDAGIPVGVNVAPIIVGLTDRDMPKILEAAAAAGAKSAMMTLVRLPGSVKEVFVARLREHFPLSAERVLARTREIRGGKLNDPRFGSRMRGEGNYAEAVAKLFEATVKRLGLDKPLQENRRVVAPKGQLTLFGK